MDWKQTIERWRNLMLEEQARIRLASLPLNVAESMAFAGEPVDLRMLGAEHARDNPSPDESKLALEPSPKRK